MFNFIVNYAYDKLKKLNSEDILEAFLNFQDKAKIVKKLETTFTEDKQLTQNSDYMIYLRCCRELDSSISDKKFKESNNPSLEYKAFRDLRRKKAILAQNKGLSERINNGIPFKYRFVENLFYITLSSNYYFLQDYEKTISYCKHVLAYSFSLQEQLNLSKSYFHLKNYKKALEAFKQAKEYPNFIKEDKNVLKRENLYYLSLLELTNHKDEYDQGLSAYNQEILENRLKNNSGFKKKAQKSFNLLVEKEKDRLEREANQPKAIVSKSQTKEQIKQENDYSLSGPALENQKKNYTKSSSNKKKTRGLTVPAAVVPPVVAVEVPVVRVEEVIENNPYKIFERLFGPYEKSPIMDQHIKIHPDELETLFKALNFPFSRSNGKGDHMKATLLSTNDNKVVEEMMIIPYRTEIGPFYIRSLRESLIRMGFYPKELEETLREKGLLN